MVLSTENILLIGSILLFISIIAGKTSYKFGVPTLLLFLSIGMLAGSDGIGKIHFDNHEISQFIGIVSLNFILFSGGLSTNWKYVKPVWKQGFILSTLGVFITAVSLGIFVWYITDFTIYESLLLGSIVSSTDAAAVFSILRAKNLYLKDNLQPILELESGSNDPMAYVLTISFLSLITMQNQDFISIILLFLKQMIFGIIFGFLFAKISKTIINNIKLDYEGLYPVLVISLMFMIFSFTDYIGGNGFLAIYISSVYLGNQKLIHKKAILEMYDGLAWLMQIVLFLTLGLLVFPKQLIPITGIALIISLFLILVARPISIFISLIFFKIKMRTKIYISWVGLRGAVPIVFATYPLLAGIDKAYMIFNIVFFISLTSILIQGTTIPIFAKILKVTSTENETLIPKNNDFVMELPRTAMKEIDIKQNYSIINKKIFELNLPENILIAMIKRNNEYLIPGGSTKIESNDKLIILSDNQETLDKISEYIK